MTLSSWWTFHPQIGVWQCLTPYQSRPFYNTKLRAWWPLTHWAEVQYYWSFSFQSPSSTATRPFLRWIRQSVRYQLIYCARDNIGISTSAANQTSSSYSFRSTKHLSTWRSHPMESKRTQQIVSNFETHSKTIGTLYSGKNKLATISLVSKPN